MRLYHVTPNCNLDSILERGLLLSYAQTVTRVIWLCRWRNLDWAKRHCAKRHDVSQRDLMVWSVTIPDGWVQWVQQGLWICYRDIPSHRLDRMDA